MNQEQKKNTGYQDQTTSQEGNVVMPEIKNDEKSRPMNGYEFVLKVLAWAEENTALAVFFCSIISYVLIQILQLFMK